jgi:hypothetical protein
MHITGPAVERVSPVWRGTFQFFRRSIAAWPAAGRGAPSFRQPIAEAPRIRSRATRGTQVDESAQRAAGPSIRPAARPGWPGEPRQADRGKPRSPAASNGSDSCVLVAGLFPRIEIGSVVIGQASAGPAPPLSPHLRTSLPASMLRPKRSLPWVRCSIDPQNVLGLMSRQPSNLGSAHALWISMVRADRLVGGAGLRWGSRP